MFIWNLTIRLKAERKAAAKRAKEQKRKQKESIGSGLSVAERLQNKKQRAIEEMERGDDHNALMNAIKDAADDFHSRQQVRFWIFSRLCYF